jgi:large subunit ribosomal protein L10
VQLNREEKKKAVAELKEKFQSAKGLVLTDYKGMDVSEMNALREALRKSSIEYRVIKNTLARIATEGTPASLAKDSIAGPVGIAMDYEDSAKVAREILRFAKANDKFKVTCGVIDGAFCDREKLRAISELPPRDVLLGMVAGTIQAPLVKLGQLFTATVGNFAHALSALKEKRATEQQ